ncbi:phytochelatin synthase family protein [Polyangium sp. 15x6]|uniref:phytochelatin synthase family protein n=1 Tax=Polyangium sp. 15x6 TaxID=3042687 RepID=UPI00249CDF6B|nr:phytochelatin synthase family protein [Polyangium sp. 15x6]MDI3289302.1 phytochelatin synthase family protein [Polyangium sp. 15x6]
MKTVPKAQPSFYKRPLPEGCISFSSADGRAIFREALSGGTMEGFFSLIEQFHTQAEPAFCGLGTLVMVLNALAIDPGRAWKGPWRWYAEEHLDCCRPLDAVARDGITLTQFACLARCNGTRTNAHFAESSSVEVFRKAIRDATSRPGETHFVVAYDRATLGQTGSGHFSPIGGMHADRDLALLLDVARFKYPPHWVPIETLFRAMLPIDQVSGRSRGFMTIEREHPVAPVTALRDDADWTEIEHFLRDLDGTDVLVLAGCLQAGVSPAPRLLEILRGSGDVPASLQAQVERLRAQVSALQDASRPPSGVTARDD